MNLLQPSFREVRESDLPLMAEVINYYVFNTTYTFHQSALTAEDMREKLFFRKPYYKSIAVCADDEVVGYAAVSEWKKQESYRHAAEIHIFLRHDRLGRGVGSAAIAHLEDFARDNDIHVLIAGICAENAPSLRMFERAGYKLAARFSEVGWKFGRILDMVYLQKIIGGNEVFK